MRLLIDVRTAPGSKRNLDVAREAMSRWLAEVTARQSGHRSA
jgi:hypothetical protein